MILNRNGKINTIIILLTIIFIFVGSVNDAEARRRKKKRTYHPNITKQQAIDIIRTNSESVSEIAGLEPKVVSNAEANALNATDGEGLSTEVGDRGEVIEELEQEDDVLVSIEEFNTLWGSYLDEEIESPYTGYGIQKSEIMNKIMGKLGTPYKFGGTSDGAIDCSAFTQKIFLESADVLLPRVAREQINVGKKISRKNLEFGDLIFFYTYSKRFASHVGIYLGDNLFAHASSKYGVTVSSLESSYYKKNFIGGRRLTSKDIANYGVKRNEYLNAERSVKHK